MTSQLQSHSDFHIIAPYFRSEKTLFSNHLSLFVYITISIKKKKRGFIVNF